MGRKPKTGLDYFPKDVDYYDDFNIMDLMNEYGPLGQTIYRSEEHTSELQSHA